MDSSREVMEQHLQVFAADGLRTLVLARKEVGSSGQTASLTTSSPSIMEWNRSLATDRVPRVTC